MKVGTSVRTMIAPLALAVVFAVGSARVAGAQQSANQPAQQPPAAQPPATQPPATQPPATQPPAAQPPAAQEAAEATFSGTVGVLLVQIKTDQTAAYEGLLTKLKEALSKSDKPERKTMAGGWKVYKSAEAQGGNTLYVHIVDPVAQGQNYLETYKLIAETFPSEVQDLYAKTKEAFVTGGLGRLNLTLVTALGQ
jgi:hypothetical protein